MMFLTNLLLVGDTKGLFGDKIIMPIILVGFLAFFYFFVIRPQSKKKKEMENMLNSIKKGEKVITIGGIHGKVSNVKDNEITVRVDSNAEITFEKSAIAKVVKPGMEGAQDTKESKK